MDNEHSTNSVNGESDSSRDLLWGAVEIAKAINLNQRQVFHMHRTGAVKAIRRVGGKLVASRAALLRELGAAS